MVKFCPKCGNRIELEDSQFCNKCGAKLPITSPEVQQPVARPATAQKPSYPTYIPPVNSSTTSVQTPAPQSQGPTAEITTKKRTVVEWIAIVCGGIILLVFLSAFIAGMLSGMSGTSTAPSPNNPFSTPTPTPTPSIEQIKNDAQTITYDDLARYNEKYIGKMVYFRGKIRQVFPQSGDYYDLIIDTSGIYSLVEGRIYVSNYKGSRFLEGDTIDVWGKVNGLVTLKSVLGAESDLPKLTTLHAELVQKVS